MKVLNAITLILVIIGGLNWLLVAIWKQDLFTMIGLDGVVATIVYVVVGLSAIWQLFFGFKKSNGAPSQM